MQAFIRLAFAAALAWLLLAPSLGLRVRIRAAGLGFLVYLRQFAVVRTLRREYWGIQVINFLDNFYNFAYSTVAVILMSQSLGFSDIGAGKVLFWMALIKGIFLFASGPIVDRYGLRSSLLTSIVVVTVMRIGLAVCVLWYLLPSQQVLYDLFERTLGSDLIQFNQHIADWYGLRMTVATPIPEDLFHELPWRPVLFVAFMILAALPVAVKDTSYHIGNKTYTTEATQGAGFNVWYIIMNISAVPAGLLVDFMRQRELHYGWFIVLGIATAVTTFMSSWLMIRPRGKGDWLAHCRRLQTRLPWILTAALHLAYRLAVIGLLLLPLLAVLSCWRSWCALRGLPWYRLAFMDRMANAFWRNLKSIAQSLRRQAKSACSLHLVMTRLRYLAQASRRRQAQTGRSWSRLIRPLRAAVILTDYRLRLVLSDVPPVGMILLFGATVLSFVWTPLFAFWPIALIRPTRLEGLVKVMNHPSFARMMAAVTLNLGVSAVFIYWSYISPKYWDRAIGPGAAIGKLSAINPIIIVLGLVLLVPIIDRFKTFTMLTVGSFIAASSLLPLAVPWTILDMEPVRAYYVLNIVAMVIFSFGEMMFSPRLSQYILAVAPVGQEGIYSSFAALPGIARNAAVGYASGLLLTRWCPETRLLDGTVQPLHKVIASRTLPYWETPEAMWLVLFVVAIVGPLLMLPLRRWFVEGMKVKSV